jgi:hypothetical protein
MSQVQFWLQSILKFRKKKLWFYKKNFDFRKLGDVLMEEKL